MKSQGNSSSWVHHRLLCDHSPGLHTLLSMTSKMQIKSLCCLHWDVTRIKSPHDCELGHCCGDKDQINTLLAACNNWGKVTMEIAFGVHKGLGSL